MLICIQDCICEGSCAFWIFLVSLCFTCKKRGVMKYAMSFCPYFLILCVAFLYFFSNLFVFPPVIYLSSFLSYFSQVKLPPAHLFHTKRLTAAVLLLLENENHCSGTRSETTKMKKVKVKSYFILYLPVFAFCCVLYNFTSARPLSINQWF